MISVAIVSCVGLGVWEGMPMSMNLIFVVVCIFLALSLWQIETVQFQNFAGSLFSAEAPERLSSDRFFAMPTPLLSESLVWGSDTASDSESDSSVSVAKVSFEEKYAHLLQSDSDSDEELLGKQRAKFARCTEPDNLSNIGNDNDDDVNDKFACRTDPDPQSVMMIADTDSDVSMSGNIEATQSLFESDSLMQLWKRPSLSNHREVFGDTLENIKIDVRAQLPSDSEDDPGKNDKDKGDNDNDDDAPRRRESFSSEALVDADPDILTDQMEQAENYPGIDWSKCSEYHSLVTILDSLDEVVAGFNRPCYVGICRSPAERWANMGSHSHANSFRNMYVIACASKAHLNFLERKCIDHGKTQRYQLKSIASGGQPIHRATHGFLYVRRG